MRRVVAVAILPLLVLVAAPLVAHAAIPKATVEYSAVVRVWAGGIPLQATCRVVAPNPLLESPRATPVMVSCRSGNPLVAAASAYSLYVLVTGGIKPASYAEVRVGDTYVVNMFGPWRGSRLLRSGGVVEVKLKLRNGATADVAVTVVNGSMVLGYFYKCGRYTADYEIKALVAGEEGRGSGRVTEVYQQKLPNGECLLSKAYGHTVIELGPFMARMEYAVVQGAAPPSPPKPPVKPNATRTPVPPAPPAPQVNLAKLVSEAKKAAARALSEAQAFTLKYVEAAAAAALLAGVVVFAATSSLEAALATTALVLAAAALLQNLVLLHAAAAALSGW